MCMCVQEQLRIRRQFVSDHESYNTVYHQCRSWCEDFAARLEQCIDMDDSRASIESKLSQLNALSHQYADEGAGCIQRVRDATSVVLISTSADGGSAVNKAVSELITYWEALADKITSARNKMESALTSCNEFEASLSKLLQQLRDAEDEQNQLSTLQSTLAEKTSFAKYSKVCFVCCSVQIVFSLPDMSPMQLHTLCFLLCFCIVFTLKYDSLPH